MPTFGKIDDLLVVENKEFLVTSLYTAFGIDHHYHSYCIQQDNWSRTCAIDVSKLNYPQTFRTHELDNDFYITCKSLITKL